MAQIPTPHIGCSDPSKIAKTVLMPGDPLRAKYIAENFLTDVECFNTVRGALGFTGYYKGKKVSVMGSGMGMPSIGIYSFELFNFYGVDRIIRIGSAGSYDEDVKVLDVVITTSAYSTSNYALIQAGDTRDTIPASTNLTNRIREVASILSTTGNAKVHEGTIYSSDVFYSSIPSNWKELHDEKGCLCVEMESFALFSNANVLGKEAACILTISDSFVAKEILTSKEREQSLTNMITLALEVAISYEN